MPHLASAGKGGTGPCGLAPFLGSERHLGSERRLPGSSGRTHGAGPELFSLGPGKTTHQDSYTLTEELAEYAEIRVK